MTAPNPLACHIRSATAADAETILAFIHELAVYEREPDAVQTSADVLRAQLNSASPPFECLLAVTSDDEALGFALFFHNYSTWRGARGLYLEDLFVPQRYRKRGVGGALLRTLAAIAVERDCARMEWAVLDWNQLAIDFYVNIGAVPMSEWTTFRLTGAPLLALASSTSQPN